MDEWNTKSLTVFEMWSEIFEFVQSECISFKITQLILGFSFAIPGNSASTERVFSITNALWTDKRSRFLVETVKVMIVTKTHFEEFCATTSVLDFKQFPITSINPFIYEVQVICPTAKSNSFNINWKLTSNRIL
jgi:hypothetical protein